MKKNSKIYIAGHNGMVGSAILRNLKNKGYSNFVFTPYEKYDLTNQQVVVDFFAKEKPDYVILAAAKVGGIIANTIYRAQFIYENLQIQNNVIHQSYVSGVKKLLFLGSSCIYPKNSPQPMQEEYLLTSPLEYTNEPYAIAKIAGIKMCESYNLQYGCNFISVMPTNLFGQNDNFDLEKSHVLPAIIRKMHLGKCLQNTDWQAIRQDLDRRPIETVSGKNTETDILKILAKYGITYDKQSEQVSITLWGSGAPRREFLHADELADACVFLMENTDFQDIVKEQLKIDDISKLPPETDIRNTHINIGTGKDLPISELADIVQKITAYTGKVHWDSTKPDGTMRKLMQVDKLKDLGWQSRYSFTEKIAEVYANYRETTA